MGEIDTKPIESVQTAITFFGQQRNDHRRNSPTKDQKEFLKERELESLEKDLANFKLQLEAQESAYKQAILKIDHHQNTADELTILLINTDFQKYFYASECREAHLRVNELESAINQMANKLLESKKVHEQLTHVTSDLEKELNILREAKVESLSKAEALGNALSVEKLKTKELIREVCEANEAIMCLKVKALEDEKEKAEALSKIESELECALKQLEIMHDLENQLMEKSAYVSSLQLEINEANMLQLSSEKTAFDAISEQNQLKEDLQSHEKTNSDQTAYISVLETEIEQLKTELGNVVDVRSEFEKIKEKENEAQVEIALLNYELHKGRSKLAGAEADVVRAQGDKSALYNTLHEMGLEAEEIKKENRMLKDATKSVDDDDSRKNEELEHMKRELEIAVLKIEELRTRAEQAISRAEVAERAKGSLEDEMKRRKEHKERRKAALAALREESVSRDYGTSNNECIVKHDSGSVKSYQPLGKVLNMKF